MTGIYISTIVLSCILGIAIYISNTKINKNNLFSFILTLGVMYLLGDFIAARAQLVTYILFVLEILFIESFIRTKKKRYALRTYDDCMLNSKPSCSIILYILYILHAIHCRIPNSIN